LGVVELLDCGGQHVHQLAVLRAVWKSDGRFGFHRNGPAVFFLRRKSRKALEAIRNNQARRFDPGLNDARAEMAFVNVSCAKSCASWGLPH